MKQHHNLALIIALSFLGCSSTQSRAYSYCVAEAVERTVVHGRPMWVAHCRDNGSVVFSVPVKKGEGVYYTPYWEDDDAVTEFGYVHSENEIL